MRQKVVLVTGANGEIGHGLIQYLAESTDANIVALDVVPLDKNLRPYCSTYIVGDILDQMLLGRMVVEHEIATIYHLASILSTKAEYNPETAHRINVEGTLNLLRLAVEQSQWQGSPVKFIYPSSDCSLWDPDSPAKRKRRNRPRKMNGAIPIPCTGVTNSIANTLAGYYNSHYRQLSADCGDDGNR